MLIICLSYVDGWIGHNITEAYAVDRTFMNSYIPCPFGFLLESLGRRCLWDPLGHLGLPWAAFWILVKVGHLVRANGAQGRSLCTQPSLWEFMPVSHVYRQSHLCDHMLPHRVLATTVQGLPSTQAGGQDDGIKAQCLNTHIHHICVHNAFIN